MTTEFRERWPEILEVVRQRRRFSWLLLSQNGKLANVDGQVVTVAFPNQGATDNFVSTGSDRVLADVLDELLSAGWRVECTVDPDATPRTSEAPRRTASRTPGTPRRRTGPPVDDSVSLDHLPVAYGYNEDDDSGYGPGSYFEHAMGKD
ncbi:hypothetical protein [Streptomyces sp. NPDC056883]|uniref:hypothetical protein n=1 Tax=Streptomyces sp. NPDC056883 TaxID=3345959 RepID=UPI0036CD77F6